jgi:hypothetical protein
MKTLRLFMAVGLLLGSYFVGMAQDNGTNFKSEAEKQAWVESQSDVNSVEQERNDPNVRSEERFSSEAEKQAWLKSEANSEIEFSSEAEKEAWIAKNPEQYNRMVAETKENALNRKLQNKPNKK